ncbi:hypothetical protein AALC16_01215 [Lachnospiraceae bacterium 29-91]
MYFQFLIEDGSTNILVNHVMEKLTEQYKDKEIIWNIKFFGGIGHLSKKGSVWERKTGKLLNDLPMFMKGFSKVLADIVYPQGYLKLKKRAVGNYSEIGNAKCEWADKIGKCLHLHENSSPSYQYFIGELEKRIIA